MMRSMFSGVSGLRAHQTRMDVIGNNIANVNTIGFKSGRVTFQEVFNQTLKGAGAPDTASGRGGVNPMQVGLGIGIGSVDTITTRGSLQRTDNPTDISIEGEGFLIVQNGAGEEGLKMFTRAGNFGVDKLGNLVTGSGMNVMGWQKYNPDTYEFDIEQKIGTINLYSDEYNKNKRLISAKETTKAEFAGNLNSKNAVATATQLKVPVTVYDKLGNKYTINLDVWKSAAASGATTWEWQAAASGVTVAGSGTLGFTGASLSSGGSGSITITPATSAGTVPFTVSLDFNKLTMYSADTSAKTTNVDGYPTGNLVTFSLGADGVITGVYDNGKQQPLGMLALASFENPSGLQKVGDNMFMQTTNSGEFRKAVKAGAEGVGGLNPGTLEMSNVDLSREFTDMIVTQRGFQANSRIITTSDEMLQELVNLKR